MSPVTGVGLTCGATALVLDADGFFALALSCQAGGLQCAAAPVCKPVGAAHLVVALARAYARFLLLVLVASDALEPGTAAARGSASAAAARFSFHGRAHWAAAARVPQRTGGTALRRERSTLSRVTRSACRTSRDPDREHSKDWQNRNQAQHVEEVLHGLTEISDAVRCGLCNSLKPCEIRSADWAV